MARKAKETSRQELSGDDTPRLMRGGRQLPRRSGAVREKAPREAADFELYEVAELVLGAGGLTSFTITDNEKARVQALVDFVADAVSQRRLESPGERAQDYYTLPFFEAEAERFSAICWGLIEYFAAGESINADRLAANASEDLRRFLERMDDHDRKKTIAGLMAYIGELQTAGVLEATPSDRLARVAMLIGEAAALVKAKVPASTSTLLFEHRQADPKTGEKCTAIEWYNTHWRERVEAGDVFANDIKHADLKLYQAIASHQRRAGKTLSDLIPVRVPRNQFDDTPEGQAARAKHLRAQNTRNVRRYRQNKSVENTAVSAPLWEKEQASALDWFNLNWRPRIEAENLFSDDLKRADPQLYSALAAAQTRAGASLGDLIPLRRRRLASLSPAELAERDARIRAQSKFRTRRRRAAPKPS